MAVKAIAMIHDYRFDGSDNIYFFLKIGDGAHLVDSVEFGPTPKSTLDVSVNTDIKNFVQSYAENNWGTVFTPLVDSVRLLFRVDVF